MRYVRLGASGLKISEVMLGCARFGEIPDDDAHALVDAAIDAGISTFDVADAYNGGRAEEVLGAALRGRRDRVVLCSKVGLRVGDDESGHAATMLGRLDHASRWQAGISPNEAGLSRTHIMSAIDASLRRLQTDHLDLYQVHRFDPETPLEETLSALSDLVRLGKVRYVGCSAFAAWQLHRALWVGDVGGFEPLHSMQVGYNLLSRDAERDVLPATRAGGVGVLAFQVVAGGMLSGRYRADVAPEPNSRLGTRAVFRNRYWNDATFGRVDALRQLAEQHGRTVGEAATSWVLGNPDVCAVIIGASRASQLDDAVNASHRPIDAELRASISAI